jgi:ERCC4-type nuclease
MLVSVDVHERGSGVPRELVALGVEIEECSLRAGDYRLGELALIERKTVRDLHLTVIEGRFWWQMSKLRRAAGWPYLLIEGRSIYDGPLNPEAVRGLLLATTDIAIGVVISRDAAETARWIRRIAIRRTSARATNRPVYAQRPKRPAHAAPPEQALAAAAGVSTVTAKALLRHFGSLRDVLLATPQQLTSVTGVGPTKARAIHALATEQLAIPAKPE